MGDPVVANLVPRSTFVKNICEERKETNISHGTFHSHSISRKNPDFCPDSGFSGFFHPKPGQFHVDSGNPNFIKIGGGDSKYTYRHTHTTSKFIY